MYPTPFIGRTAKSHGRAWIQEGKEFGLECNLPCGQKHLLILKAFHSYRMFWRLHFCPQAWPQTNLGHDQSLTLKKWHKRGREEDFEWSTKHLALVPPLSLPRPRETSLINLETLCQWTWMQPKMLSYHITISNLSSLGHIGYKPQLQNK